MGNANRIDPHITNGKAPAGSDRDDTRPVHVVTVHPAAIDRAARHKHIERILPHHRLKTRYVVGMLVGYQHGIDLIGIFTDGPESGGQRPGTESAIDQQAHLVGPDERRVTPTPATQNGNFYRHLDIQRNPSK